MMFTLTDYRARTELRRLDGGKFDPVNKTSRLVIWDPPGGKLTRLVRVKHGTTDRALDWTLSDIPGKFYLAGPMRGYPLCNFPAFLMAARILTARGFEIMSPAEKDLETGFDPSKPIDGQGFDVGAAFRWDFKAVADCDGTILLPGWEGSTGATAERLVAQLSQREVYLLRPDYTLIEAPEMEYSLTWSPPKRLSPNTPDLAQPMCLDDRAP